MCYPQISWKLMLTCSVLALVSAAARAQEPAGIKWRTDYVAARKESEAKNLPLIIDFVRPSCVPCERMEQVTFRDPKIVTVINDRFVPLRINGPDRPQLTADLGVSLFPTVVLASPDGHLFGQALVGFQEADILHDHLQRLVASLKPPDPLLRDFQNAQKWEAAGNYADAIKTLRGILDDSRAGPLQKNAQDLLSKIERRAAERLAVAKALEEKGQYAEALETLDHVRRVYPGVSASKEAAEQSARLSHANEGAKIAQRTKRVRELFAQAQDFYKTKDYIPCLDRCKLIIAHYGDLPEGQQAFALVAEIKNNPEWLQGAADVTTDLLGDLLLALADSHLKRGNVQLAQTFLQRVMVAFPGSRMAESAQIRLMQLRSTPPAGKGVESARP